MYFGGTAATDWVNLNKVAIPQADEQQRLLANLIEQMNRDRKPLPRFWYFPRSLKAVVVATGDDHGNGGTAGAVRPVRLAAARPGCSVANWDVPAVHLVRLPERAADQRAGVVLHVPGLRGRAAPAERLLELHAASLDDRLRRRSSPSGPQKYSEPPGPDHEPVPLHASGRDWAGQPTTELAHGIRFDTNYYYWPGTRRHPTG